MVTDTRDARTFLIGQAPSRAADGMPAFSGAGRSGRTIAALCGVDEASDAFLPLNLIERWPGKARTGEGDAFPIALARAAAAAIDLRGRRAVLVGWNVARAFGLRPCPPLTWQPLAGGKVAVLPHPSGLNRWWNEPANREAARLFMREAAAGRTPAP